MRSLKLLIAVGYMALVLATAGLALGSDQRPYAPLSVLPPPAPVTLLVVHGTETEAWLTQATQAFAASGATVNDAPIEVELRALGSREAGEQIAAGTLQPAAWLPASDLWTMLLDQAWQERTGAPLLGTGEDSPRSLAQTPLVVAVWRGRVDRLGDDDQSIWQRLHAQRDTVRWAHTAPTPSNSGTQALVLMAYTFHNKASGLTVADVQDPAFVQWLRETEQAAMIGDNSAALINDMIAFGPSRYDAVVTYENLAVQAQKNAARWNDDLVLIYPPATSVSNHPYALVNGAWVTAQQRAAARQFRDFLLSRAQQEQALQLGFRPALVDIALDGGTSPLRPDVGVQIALPDPIEVPDAATLNALLDTWTRTAQR